MGASCFYTIEPNGTATCKEFPDEFIDLSNYETMLRVAVTIYKDITQCADDDAGLSGAFQSCQDEPQWKGANLFPDESET